LEGFFATGLNLNLFSGYLCYSAASEWRLKLTVINFKHSSFLRRVLAKLTSGSADHFAEALTSSKNTFQINELAFKTSLSRNSGGIKERQSISRTN
jgi:hypothetical protein